MAIDGDFERVDPIVQPFAPKSPPAVCLGLYLLTCGLALTGAVLWMKFVVDVAPQDVPSRIWLEVVADLFLTIGLLLTVLGAATAFGLPKKYAVAVVARLLAKIPWLLGAVFLCWVAVVVSLTIWPELVQPAG